jgi:hypothetical protein
MGYGGFTNHPSTRAVQAAYLPGKPEKEKGASLAAAPL